MHQPRGYLGRGIGATAALEPIKGPAEGSWAKRSAHTLERLQPVGTDTTRAATHDNNNNSLKRAKTGAENKSLVPPLTKKIPSRNGKGKPGTESNAKDLEPEKARKGQETKLGNFCPR